VENARLLGLSYNVMHRHGNDWVKLEQRRAHDPAETDPERDWPNGVVYACPKCDEQVVVIPQDERSPNG
jgi:hypothetical protein